jgi:hypothetical protein
MHVIAHSADGVCLDAESFRDPMNDRPEFFQPIFRNQLKMFFRGKDNMDAIRYIGVQGVNLLSDFASNRNGSVCRLSGCSATKRQRAGSS